ncbi:DUF4157 domain-containing protein [Spirulina major]|uniref:eCIS core domain-containing protein n=1 Tax=Spirulina major TaxID=270636 RepID=UPI000934AA29|nr:DUF4157 domain-containing protein [Spirulina major]
MRSHFQKKPQTSTTLPPQTNQFAPPIIVQAKADPETAELPQWNPGQRKTLPNLGQNPVQTPVQAKLTIGQPGDRYEQEADHVASQVVHNLNAPSADQSVQRKDIKDDELQMKPQLQRAVPTGAADPELEQGINRAKGGGQSLDPTLQTKMGQAMGADFSGVKIHTDAQSDQLNQSIQAKAFTTGQDVFFRQGEYQPTNPSGQHLIAHELTHVVQQNGGAVQRSPIQQPIIQRVIGVTPEELAQQQARLRKRQPEQAPANPNQGPSRADMPRRSIEVVRGINPIDPSKRNAGINPIDPSKRNARHLLPEQQEQLQKDLASRPNILKFNFAGSGEPAWKTHRKPENPNKKQMDPTRHKHDGLKYGKEKKAQDSVKKVVEYAGPLGKILGLGAGAADRGKNSTAKNLDDAKDEFTNFMVAYWELKTKYPDIPKVQINIKGFSRGSATATTFATWIKNASPYSDDVDVNLVVLDAVHGTGPTQRFGQGKMTPEQDVSDVYDENKPDNTGTTYLMPVKSGYPGDAFKVQHLTGYQRLIIAYGPNAIHSFGHGESQENRLKWNNEPVKGMKLSTLPKGLFVVEADDLNIKQVTSMDEWETKYQDQVLGKANKKEGRDVVIREAVAKFLR